MNEKKSSGVHWSFWPIGVVALIWNILGVLNFFWQRNPDALAVMSETHRAIIEGRPIWATGAFAIAVFGGALGCVLLLLRKSVAYFLFFASLLGVIVQLPAHFGMADRPIDILMIIVMPLVVAAFLIWYTKLAAGKGWIR